MKKLFISVPMRNRTEYAIKASMEQMHKIAEAVFGEELEVIPTYFEDDPPENTNMALWYLGESIKKLSEADRFIGIYDEDKRCLATKFPQNCITATMDGISIHILQCSLGKRTIREILLRFISIM